MHHHTVILLVASLRAAYSHNINTSTIPPEATETTVNVTSHLRNTTKLTEVEETKVNITSHLRLPHIQRVCARRRAVCASNDSRVCAVRRAGGDTGGGRRFEHRDFGNWCFLWMSNVCDHPGQEYSIARSGSCAEYLKTRRMYVDSGLPVNTSPRTTPGGASTNTTKPGRAMLRSKTFSPIYPIGRAYDDHICPLRCPNVYAPQCVCANRLYGKYRKMWTFVNHCEGDRYYCMHKEEFAPPEDEKEHVTNSYLSWSFCGSNRYLQFARFSESTSAMGHYGWLEGDFKYTHIMEPHERQPGFG